MREERHRDQEEVRASTGVEALASWIEMARPTAAALERVIRDAEPWRREAMAELASRRAPSLSRGLVRLLVAENPEVVVALAAHPSLQDSPNMVRHLLGICMKSASAYHPSAPLGPYTHWPCFRAGRALLERGLVRFPNKVTKGARTMYTNNPEVRWAQVLVHADPHTPATLLEKAWRRLRRMDLSRVREAKSHALVELIRRDTAPHLMRSRWEQLLALSPDGAASLAELPHVRQRLGARGLQAMLANENQAVRLAAIRSISSSSAPLEPAVRMRR